MSSRDRVPEHTRAEINQYIEDQTRSRVEHYARNPDQIDQRLRQLDEEWDIERTLEMNSSVISLFGLAMGFAVNRRWFFLPLAVQFFFFQHAVQGWCPPLPILRRMGFRTSDEINLERTALKAIRGDFERVNQGNEAPLRTYAVWEAVAH